MSQAIVTDAEDSNVIAVTDMSAEADRPADMTFYTIIDYSPTDFTNFHHEGFVTVTY